MQHGAAQRQRLVGVVATHSGQRSAHQRHRCEPVPQAHFANAVGEVHRRIKGQHLATTALRCAGWAQSGQLGPARGHARRDDEQGVGLTLAQLGVGPLVVLSGAVSQYAAPIVFARIGAGLTLSRVAEARALVIRLVLGGLVVTAVIVTSVVVAGGPVFRLLVDPRFIGAGRLWPVAVLAGGLFGVSQLASLLPLALSRPKLLLPVKIVHSVVAISATVAGGLSAGVAGIMWGAVVANALALVWTLWIALSASIVPSLAGDVGDVGVT